MLHSMRGAALPRRRYTSPHHESPAHGLLDALNRPELVRASEISQPDSAPQPAAESTGISPLRWLAGQFGLLDLLGATDAAAQPPITPREPDEPSWFDRTEARFREMFPPVPPPEMVRDGRGGVWRKDIYDLIEDIAVAERDGEAALRRRIQDVLADAPLTRDRWFHYELSNRLDGDDSEAIRTALRDWGHEDAIQVREQWSQLIPSFALAGSQLLQARARQPVSPTAVPATSATAKQSDSHVAKPALPENTASGGSTESIAAIAPVRRANRTRFGIKRAASADWHAFRRLWDEGGYGNILSPTNRLKIDDGLSPVVDETWVKYFPEDAGLLGQKIEMHHIGGLVVRLPWPHRRHMDAHLPGGTRWNLGGPGSAAPFYPSRQRHE